MWPLPGVQSQLGNHQERNTRATPNRPNPPGQPVSLPIYIPDCRRSNHQFCLVNLKSPDGDRLSALCPLICGGTTDNTLTLATQKSDGHRISSALSAVQQVTCISASWRSRDRHTNIFADDCSNIDSRPTAQNAIIWRYHPSTDYQTYVRRENSRLQSPVPTATEIGILDWRQNQSPRHRPIETLIPQVLVFGKTKCERIAALPSNVNYLHLSSLTTT